MQAAQIVIWQRWNGAVCCCVMLFAACAFHSVAARGVMGVHSAFLSLVTCDLDIQTRPSEGPNTSSLRIWRRSVQPLRRYLIHKQKKQTRVADSTKN